MLLMSSMDIEGKILKMALMLKDIKAFFSWCVPRYIAHSPCALHQNSQAIMLEELVE